MKSILIFLLMIFSANSLGAGSDFQTTDLPSEVVKLIDRVRICNHWAGEYGYDADRQTQIEGAVADFACTSLHDDIETVRVKYKNNSAVINALNEYPLVY